MPQIPDEVMQTCPRCGGKLKMKVVVEYVGEDIVWGDLCEEVDLSYFVWKEAIVPDKTVKRRVIKCRNKQCRARWEGAQIEEKFYCEAIEAWNNKSNVRE